MNEVIMFGLFGMMGGAVRVFIGALKTYQLKGEIDKGSLGIYIVSLLVIGAFTGIVMGYGKVISFLAGYAGIDLIEGFYKSFMKKKINVRK